MSTELDQARAKLAEIEQKYTRADQQQYKRLLLAAWRYHIRILESQANEHRSNVHP